MRAASRRSAVVASVLVAGALAGCTVGESAAPERTQTPMVNPNPAADAVAVVTPEQIEAAVADIPRSVRAAMDATGTPGIAVGVVHGDEVIFAEGFGVRDVDSGEPVDSATVFALASVSKSVGSTVVARAIDEGIVSWNTPVAENLEGFTLSDPVVGARVTIADMYAHRSGLFEHAGDELEEIGYDREEIIERLRHIPLEPWRAVYHYGNFDITTAAESVARASGEDWASLSERLVYEPLGMTSTSSRFADLEERENRALGHIRDDDEWIVNPAQRQPDAQSPAGGVSSNIDDLTTWTSMLLAAGEHDGSRFVEETSLLPAMSPQMIQGAPNAWGARAGMYGYGWNVGTTVGGLVDVNHSGAFAMGTGTIVKMLPGADIGIIVLSNAAANGVAEGIANRFMDIAQFGEERRDWLDFFISVFEQLSSEPLGEFDGQEPPTDAAPPADLASYAGEYANEYFGAARVEVRGGELVLSLGPTGRWPLEHWSGDVFVFRPTGENSSPTAVSQATFDGATLVLEYFDRHDLGTFTRAAPAG
ncbi:serine hydrolase [Microbacterium sp. RU33B]|uniref:serine hydrolase n=1 Tax=Microbacterium sp. RU33B TaxID=1907390 RepID=UPI000968BA63|nr:serine hydrolase [Microbacterium sp. RU33B]SIT86952.1 CubicO group peptidase, beta-lactamase class C family [Microbacterium sp. RU33B]